MLLVRKAMRERVNTDVSKVIFKQKRTCRALFVPSLIECYYYFSEYNRSIESNASVLKSSSPRKTREHQEWTAGNGDPMRKNRIPRA